MDNYEDLLEGVRGRTKAALLLGFFPTETSKKIIAMLEEYERDILMKEITGMPRYDTEVIKAVVQEFLGFIKGHNMGIVNSGAEYAMRLLEGAVPEEELEEMMGRIYSNSIRPFDTLKKIKDVGPLLTFLQNEDPQTIAVVALHMKPSQAAELMQALPEEKMIQVAMGIANMDQTNKEILIKIEKHLNKKLETFMNEENNSTDGVKTLVNILNNVTRATEKLFFDRLEQIDKELTDEIKESMFVFDDIVNLDQQSLMKVVNASDNEIIAKALRVASEELKEKFYMTMSEGRKAMLTDIDEGLGRLRMSDVESAQSDIANVVKELERKGEIVLSRGEDDVIL